MPWRARKYLPTRVDRKFQIGDKGHEASGLTREEIDVDYRKQANITLWLGTVRRALRQETNVDKREFLIELFAELNSRLPGRPA